VFGCEVLSAKTTGLGALKRQVFYQATVRHLVDKSEAGYTKVQGNLSIMRRSGMLPYIAACSSRGSR
jgi:hypothetical protein